MGSETRIGMCRATHIDGTILQGRGRVSCGVLQRLAWVLQLGEALH
jgi:hypothetical protein